MQMSTMGLLMSKKNVIYIRRFLGRERMKDRRDYDEENDSVWTIDGRDLFPDQSKL